ncbi:LysR substrate-binding domain-containing protein [Denitrobaculum tricleocarpae]|uniref:LysR family transcriptional regulator n=1 Tax=Denitrobaculum tricleocarpae TaxID=2591009 RepID=A0A545TYA8_9PROT|nr:LysR substrate-binding domain-containing protein [Denitrobaculum tricleocarpae]TQV82206.1 LysR family transcriptional regulator [Denitrobaculum tricleocarpae]
MQNPPQGASDSLILAALPAIEAAARLSSFTRAAQELGLTQGAVSRRIQSLESHLGVALFTRQGRAVKITTDGLRLAESATAILRQIESTRLELSGDLTGSLRIGVLPSLGGLWLAPRLQAFTRLHPGLSVSVSTVDADFSAAHKDPVNWDPSLLDIVLTWGHGGWTPLTAISLFREEMIAVCSPDFKARHGIEITADLWTAPRLAHTTRPNAWDAFAEARSVSVTSGLQPQLAFDHFYMIREGALAGSGAALLPAFLIADDLAKGTLIQTGPTWPTGAQYAVVGTSTAFARPAAKAFLDWLAVV